LSQKNITKGAYLHWQSFVVKVTVTAIGMYSDLSQVISVSVMFRTCLSSVGNMVNNKLFLFVVLVPKEPRQA
jgi:hypothetical protein